jgi:gliding motility-associated-like protein
VDSFNFGYRFINAGEYILQQKIWVLGCSYEFEKHLTVLPLLEVAITPDTLCPEQPQELSVITNRPPTSFLWNDEWQAANFIALASGAYHVQVSDGVCTAYDTAVVLLVKDVIGDENPLQLPGDTIICNIYLPFRLVPESPFSNLFFTSVNPNLADTILLKTPGMYQIGMDALGCTFWGDFELDTSKCNVPIYLPNAFSPNGDGINDEFFPMGKDFDILELTIFDRWGGMTYQGNGRNARWTGAGAPQGVYAFLLHYQNLLTNKMEFKSGSVLLIR